MTAGESRTINDKLDAILARMKGMEHEVASVKSEFAGIRNAFATLKGDLRANI